MSDIRNLLLRLSRASERSDPLVFAGREREIAETVGRTEVLPPAGEWGNTVLIEGAPGAGKTALLRETARRLEAAGTRTIVQPDVPQIHDLEAIYAELATTLAGAPSNLTRTTETKTRNVSVGPTALRGGSTSGASVAPPRIASPRAVAALRGDGPWHSKDKAVVFVDEVQNVARGSAAAELLSALHTQQSIPVLLVCAGLSNSRAAMERAGLSRIGTANIIRLGPLRSDEAAQVARETLDLVRRQGLAGGDDAVERWGARLATASDGWPRHLQNYLKACWLTLLEQEQPSLDSTDLDAVVVRGDELRERYCSERLELARVPVEVMGALHERLEAGEHLDTFGAVAVIGQAIDGLEDPRVRRRVRSIFPDDGACFEKMLSVGVVATDQRGRCTSPAPSFGGFVLSRLRQETGS